MNGLFVFAIPLVGRHAARNWSAVLTMLRATLSSLLNQTEENFKVIVACNDVPPIPEASDRRIEFIRVPRAPAKDERSKQADTGYKRYAAMRRAVELHARYYMSMDADDLVSARLIEYVREVDDPNGYLVREGYILNYRTGTLAGFPHPDFPNVTSFDRFCGTSVILTLDPDDPERSQDWIGRIMGKGHHVARDVLVAEGRPAHEVNYPAVVYTMNSGENLSQNDNSDPHWRRALHGLMINMEKRALPQTPALKREFALTFAEAVRQEGFVLPALPSIDEGASVLAASILMELGEDTALVENLARALHHEIDRGTSEWSGLTEERRLLYRHSVTWALQTLVDLYGASGKR